LKDLATILGIEMSRDLRSCKVRNCEDREI